ncbi:unnamed protein product, partial [Ectocarpus fasciculatus]
GNVGDVRHWLGQGADVNGMSPGGWTALVYAADRSRAEVIDVLLQANADPNIAEKDGWSPLMFSAVKGDHNHQAVEWLLSIGADPNLAEKDGWTPLFFAVFSGDVELCRPILEAGSDLRHRLPSGKSVLDLARERNAPAVVELLVQ